jgi:hypothetical protein
MAAKGAIGKPTRLPRLENATPDGGCGGAALSGIKTGRSSERQERGDGRQAAIRGA